MNRAVGMHASIPEWLDFKLREAVSKDPDPELNKNLSRWITKLLIDKLGDRDQ